MKYETPELTPLAPAINAIQGISPKSSAKVGDPAPERHESSGAYEDWE